MAPALQLTIVLGKCLDGAASTLESAWGTQASWRQVPHGFAMGTPKGSKFAPHRRHFAPEKEEVRN